jgi:Queuine tRNA-ribosyltransferase
MKRSTCATATATATGSQDNHIDSGYDDRRQSPVSSNKIRLLLHAVDGCVPFLNPTQLERHFPPTSSIGELLWIGLAVRDTCVVPVFDDDTGDDKSTAIKKKKQKKQKKDKKAGKGDDEQMPSPDSGRDVNKKARGYTFAGVEPDQWLLPYTRVTVPSFDFDGITDTDTVSASSTNGQKGKSNEPNNNNKAKNKGKAEEGSSSSSPSYANTDQYVSVWTPHGRQKLTPELYSIASKRLGSKYTLSLYDYYCCLMSSNDKHKQRRAVVRNQRWFGHLHDVWDETTPTPSSIDGLDGYASSSTINKKKTLWSPSLLPTPSSTTSSTPTVTSDGMVLDEYEQQLQPAHDKGTNYKDVVSGVVFVGSWTPGILPHYFEEFNLDSESSLPQWKVILNTSSFREIIEIAAEGYINVIGTGLPTKRAKEKKALGVNLQFVPPSSSSKSHDNSSSKRIKLDDDNDNNNNNSQSQSSQRTPPIQLLDSDGCMDMTDKRLYERDPKPLVEGCTCMVCCNNGRFSRAYIHHLVCAKELVAEILLMAHNLHHLLEVIRTYNEHINTNTTVNTTTDSAVNTNPNQTTTTTTRKTRAELTSFIQQQFGA